MTFSDVKTTAEWTVAFFPADLSSSLGNALRKENLTDWEILFVKEAEEKYPVKCPRDGNGHPSIRHYADMPFKTHAIMALVSHFDHDQVLEKIYALHEDPDALAFQNDQAAAIRETLEADGMI